MADSLQARSQELTEANQVAIENARLYEQARTLAAVEERQRLARELHDSVTQSLYSLMLLAEAGRRTALGRDVDKTIENITRLGELAQQVLKEMRLLVYELRPLALEQAGLTEALQHRLDAVEKRAGVETQLLVDLEIDLPADVEAGLYRIAEEALNNSLKHAEATFVSVILRGHDHQVEMEIVDNGKGFASDALHDLGGLGLVSIRERAEALGGQATITSKPGKGTLVSIGVPVNNAN
jgi:signal transduction histidine kinase